MSKVASKVLRRAKVKKGIRSKINGTKEKPRLAIYKSNQRIYAYLVDDSTNKVLTSISSISINSTSQNFNLEISKSTGKQIAEKAKNIGINSVVFDRSGYIYHGNVRALAEGAREAGLNF